MFLLVSALAAVECYDPVTDGWFFTTRMETPVFAASACALGDRIMVAGGLEDSDDIPSVLRVLDDVIAYDPENKT